MWRRWRRVYYMSDQGGARASGKTGRGGSQTADPVRDGRLLWPSISYVARRSSSARFPHLENGCRGGKAAPIEITRRGAPGTPEVTHLSLNNQFRDLALSPDGKKVVFTAHGEVFASGARDGGAAARVTRSPANESQLAWSPDSRRVVYVSDRDGGYRLYGYDFSTNAEARLTGDSGDETAPVWSGDGKLLAFVRDAKQLCVYDPASKQTRVLATGRFPRPPFGSNRFYSWSPDSSGSPISTPARALSAMSTWSRSGRRPGRSASSPTPTAAPCSVPDGTYILFDTNQRTENNNIARIDLLVRTPPFREDRFATFRDASPHLRARQNARPPSPCRSSSRESATALACCRPASMPACTRSRPTEESC